MKEEDWAPFLRHTVGCAPTEEETRELYACADPSGTGCVRFPDLLSALSAPPPLLGAAAAGPATAPLLRDARRASIADMLAVQRLFPFTLDRVRLLPGVMLRASPLPLLAGCCSPARATFDFPTTIGGAISDWELTYAHGELEVWNHTVSTDSGRAHG
eukprot:gene21805-64780_t